MLFKTHLAIGFFVALFFLPNVAHKFSFIPLLLIATSLPDIDSAFSTFGRKPIARVVQLFTRHRGLLHSFTFCIVLTALFVLYLPVVALPFFIGYALHLLLDAFTVEGIKPFWPLGFVSKGSIPVGGAVEQALLMCFIVIDVIFLISFFL